MTLPLTILIATYNRRPILERTLDALERQTFRDFEIVVVDDGSQDGTWSFLQSRLESGAGERLKILRQENQGQGRARNRGLRRATGERVLFLGDDIFLAPGGAAEHLRAARTARAVGEERDGPVGIVGFTDWCRGEMRVTPLLEMINREGHQFGYGHMTPGEEVPFTCFYTSNVSVPRELLGEDPFDPRFTAYGWEDVELGYRLARGGLRLLYHPAAAAEHLHPMDLGDVFRRQRAVGRGLATLLEIQPELAGSSHLAPEEPPRWYPLGRHLIPPLVTLLAALDRRGVDLGKAMLHRVLMCGYYLGRAESKKISQKVDLL